MGERIETWEQEARLGEQGVGKQIVPRHGEGKNEIVFENKEDIKKRNAEMMENLKKLEDELQATEDLEKRNEISKRILNLIAGRGGETFVENKANSNT